MEQETFFCPRSPGPDSPFHPPFNGEGSHWRAEADGTRTCSYCGSLHPEDWVDIMEHYAAGDPGYHFGTTDKSYKVYANRPGTRNAGMGGIKFYGHHAPQAGTPLDLRARAAWLQAVARCRAEFPLG